MKLLRSSLLALAACGLVAAEPSATALVAASPTPGGLFLHAGARSAALAIDMAKAGNWVAAIIPADADAAAAMRRDLDAAGLIGQVSLLPAQIDGALPVPANSVSALVVDADALGGQAPAPAEIQRSLSPAATAQVCRAKTWTSITKERPTEMDVWGQFHGDASQNDHNEDGLVGQPRSLQWTGSYNEPNNIGIRTNGRISIQVERMGRKDGGSLSARNAFNGALLWTSPIAVRNRFCLLMDDSRVYVLPDGEKDGPQVMVALDVLTGKEVQRYDQGMTVLRQDYIGSNAYPGKEGWPHAILLSGVLVQTWADTVYAVDAASGKLLWKQGSTSKDRPAFVAAANGLVVAAEGPGIGPNGNYIPGLHLTGLRKVVARDLKTGTERWTWTWPTPPDEALMPYITHLVIGDGRVGVSGLRRSDPAKPDQGNGYLLNLDLASGKQVWLQDFGSVGLPRHGYFRTYIAQGKQWLVRMAVPEAFALADGKPGIKEWALDFRCHPSRTTKELAFGALSVTSLTDDRYFFSEAARSSCDLGTFPANGLLYCGPTACGCFAWMPGANTFSAEAPAKPFAGERLLKGQASAAPAPTVKTWPAADAWPMHMRDPARSAWVETTIAAKPAIAWTAKLAPPEPSQPLMAQEWNSHPLIAGPVSSPSLAEGLAVVALTHRQVVVGLDPATGTVRWTTPVDGRVDTAPTIYQGLVLVGTRLGWVYALNRDSGALVWRFLAAPRGRSIVAHGQVESAWPVFGTVTVINGLAWVSAGREISMDEGLWWWGLDPASGAVRKTCQTGLSGDWQREASMPKDSRNRPIREAGRFGCAATPPVSDGTTLYMQKFGLSLTSGERVAGLGNYAAAWKPDRPLLIVPSVFGFASDGELTRDRHGEAFLYADVPARFHAVNGKRFVSLGCDKPHVGGREGNGGRFLKRWTIQDARDQKNGWYKDEWAIDLDADWRKGPNWKPRDSHAALAVAGDAVLYTCESKLVCVGLADGAKRWELPLPAKAVYAGLAVAQGSIVVTCVDGSVVGIR
jgi:outer membrane protein assembly factor BamB